MSESKTKTTVYPVSVTIHCPYCGAENAVVYHQQEIDFGDGHVTYDVPDIHDPIYCTRCGIKIFR
jgi:DNA-directed RNA polymerase subunit RPC12/RpoP